jgi:hypothetical protein
MTDKAKRRRGPVRDIDTLRKALARIEALSDTRANDDPAKVERVLGHWNKLVLEGDVGVSRSDDVPDMAVSIDREHREAVKVYVESWIIPELRAAIAHLEGADDWDAYRSVSS